MHEYTIRDVTRMTGLSRTTILYYESKGLIMPHFAEQSDYRLYYTSDISKILFFQNLKNMGISVQEYADILEDGNSNGLDIYELILSKKTAFVKRALSLMNMWDETLALSHQLFEHEMFCRYQYSREMWVLPLNVGKPSPNLLEHWDEHFMTRNLCYIFEDSQSSETKCPSIRGISCFDEYAVGLTPEIREKLILLPSQLCLVYFVPFDVDSEVFTEALENLQYRAEKDGYSPTGAPWAHCGYRDDSPAQHIDYLTIYQPAEKKI